MKNTSTIIEFLDRFGHAEYNIERYDESYTEPSSQVITFSLEMFYDQDVAKFASKIRDIYKQEVEASLRERNPTLKRAYDEYQLLLKLSK